VSKGKETFLNVAVAVVVLCTATLTGVVLYGQFHVDRSGMTRGRQAPSYVDNWRDLASQGHHRGPADADVTVVVFSDFECPICAEFATRMYPEFAARHAGQTALVYRHWPLRQHRFAYPAARAAECAGAQGRFDAFHDLVYAEQDQLGVRAFRDFAGDAGVADLTEFERCYSSDEETAAIERDIEAVKYLGGTGTPTVIVNGWLLRGGVSEVLLDSISAQFLNAP